MIDSNQIQALDKRLVNYFQNGEFKICDEVGSVLQGLIFENIDCDFQKLTYAVDELISNRRLNSSVLFIDEGNVFDISKNNSQCYLKGFLSTDNFPILYFFTNNQRKPSFKIKAGISPKTKGYSLKVEKCDNPEILTSYKKSLDFEDSYFIRVCDINLNNDGYEIIDGMQAKTDTILEEQIYPETFCDGYANFYKFLTGVLHKNKVDSLSRITPTKFDVIYSIFYQKMKDITSFDNEFSFDDMIYMMDMVFNDRKNNPLISAVNSDGTIERNNYSELATEIVNTDTGSKDHKSREIMFINSKTGERMNARVTRSTGYMSVDIFGKNGKSLIGYLFGETNNGFTVFRGFKDGFCSENQVRVFTLNLSDNMFRLSIKRDRASELGFSEDLVLKCLDDGELSISSVSYKDVKQQTIANGFEIDEMKQKQA